MWGRLKAQRVPLVSLALALPGRLQHELAPIVLISGQRIQDILDLAYL